MAKDLRNIVSALKIASNLERMGDFAGSVAKRAVTPAALPVESPVASLSWMGETVRGMIRDVVAAYDIQDAERDGRPQQGWAGGRGLHQPVPRIPDLYDGIAGMKESPAQITGCTHLLFVAKSIERAGDHATNVAENICYIVQGRLPSEERAKGDLGSFTIVEKE